jgi:hypothetical protein
MRSFESDDDDDGEGRTRQDKTRGLKVEEGVGRIRVGESNEWLILPPSMHGKSQLFFLH